MSFTDIAPYLGLLAALALGVWQARVRSRADMDAGSLLLRQGEATARELEACRRGYRKLERDYQRLALWALDVRGKLARRAPDEPVEAMPTRTANGDTPTDFPVTDRDEVRMRHLLVDRMQLDDLRTLAFDLGCEDLQGMTQEAMARSLLDYVRTRRKWADLTKWLADNRPDIQL